MRLKFLQVKEGQGEDIVSPDVVAKAMRAEAQVDRECFWVLHLNGANRVIEKELVSIGSVTTSIVHPREVFKRVILNGAASIITVHNHPGGRPGPSPEDRAIWERLDKAGDLLGITILDHLIITPEGGYYSEKSGKSFNINNNKKGG